MAHLPVSVKNWLILNEIHKDFVTLSRPPRFIYGMKVTKMTNATVSRFLPSNILHNALDDTKVPYEYFLMCQRYDQRLLCRMNTIGDIFSQDFIFESLF